MEKKGGEKKEGGEQGGEIWSRKTNLVFSRYRGSWQLIKVTKGEEEKRKGGKKQLHATSFSLQPFKIKARREGGKGRRKGDFYHAPF